MSVLEKNKRQGGMPRNKNGKGRKSRLGLSLDANTEINLDRLAVSCGVSPTTMAYMLVKHCVEDANIVDLMQCDYNTNGAYWVAPEQWKNGTRRLVVVKR